MRNHGCGAAGGSGCWDDGSGKYPESADKHAPWLSVGDLVWFFTPSASQKSDAGRRTVSSGSRWDGRVFWFWHMRRRSADWVFFCRYCRCAALGQVAGEVTFSALPRDLADTGRNCWSYPAPCEKKFEKSKNFICIWGKMGYNKMVSALASSSKTRR